MAKSSKVRVLTARTADRHDLYQRAVQSPEPEIDFVDARFKAIRGRRASTLREDFCGTGYTSCEWVRRRATNRAFGLDLDQPTLDLGLAHNASGLTDEQRSRLHLINGDVRTPPKQARGVEIVLAMNFSYWLFKTREDLRGYFSVVRRTLAPDGVFFLDIYGGYEAMKVTEERRRIAGGFTYIWDQHAYNPVNGDKECRIHFEFRDGSRLRDAFTYHWRLWTMPEVRELLTEAGFKSVVAYCEGEDGRGGGNGLFRAATRCPADAGLIAYLSAAK